MITAPNLDLLKSILTLRRNHNSAGEKTVGRLLVKSFGFQEHQDDKGNALSYIKVVAGRDSKPSPILWSTHIDTVHANDGIAKIVFDATDTMMVASDGSSPLGADDGAGMWLLLEMIANGVPGTYIFHRGEEKGGIGSRAMAKYWPDLLKKHTHAIAFDRRGTKDVITHQFVGRCCSDRFATQLCFLLNGSSSDEKCKARGFKYEPCSGGSFTDTASYVELIPECTNISVGYDSEHTPRETLDLGHLLDLRERVIEVFKSPPELIVVRKTTDKEARPYNRGTYNGYQGSYHGYSGAGYGGMGNYGASRAHDDGFGFPPPAGGKKTKKQLKRERKERERAERFAKTAGSVSFGGKGDELYIYNLTPEQILDLNHNKLVQLIREDVAGTADLLNDLASTLVTYMMMEAELAKDAEEEARTTADADAKKAVDDLSGRVNSDSEYYGF